MTDNNTCLRAEGVSVRREAAILMFVRVVVAAAGLVMVVEPAAGETMIRLEGRSPKCLAVDARGRIWCGTSGHGVFASDDGGATWRKAGLARRDVTALAVGADTSGAAAVFAGLEPSAVCRTDDDGATWHELEGLDSLASASSWSFPPRPWTHHVRAILVDPCDPEIVHVAIEAGALVRSRDGGRTWEDRVPGGPIDTHTLSAHAAAPGWLWSAAGDGWFESRDWGDSWESRDRGLEDGYLWSVAVDAGEPHTLLVSGASGPMAAHVVGRAESRVYRRERDAAWQRIGRGLPEPRGTTTPVLAAGPEPGVFWAASNAGLFRSPDRGITWERLGLDPPESLRENRVDALAVVLTSGGGAERAGTPRAGAC